MGRTFASVLFVNADDCIKYFNRTSNGIVYKTEGKKRCVAFVQKSNDPDVVGGMLREWIEQEVTRCVAVRDIEEDYPLEKLRAVATEGRRLLESIEDGTFPPGVPGVFIPITFLFSLQLKQGRIRQPCGYGLHLLDIHSRKLPDSLVIMLKIYRMLTVYSVVV